MNLLCSFLSAGAGLAQADAPASGAASPWAPVVLLVLCVIAAVATVLVLPSRREAPLRKVGGVLLLVSGLIVAAILVRWTASATGGGMGVYFWIFSAVALVGAVRVITHTKPVYSALYFVLTVFATAGLFLLLWAEFMAAALVLIYAGAILITYVFVIMLAAETISPQTGATMLSETDTVSREPVFASAVGFAMMGLILFVIFDRASVLPRVGAEGAPALGTQLARQVDPAAEPDEVLTPAPARPRVAGATQELGVYLFQSQLVNLQMAGLILTVAMVGAIVIARKRVVVSPPIEEQFAPAPPSAPGATILGPATPVDDNPHSIPVFGTTNPRQKEYPET